MTELNPAQAPELTENQQKFKKLNQDFYAECAQLGMLEHNINEAKQEVEKQKLKLANIVVDLKKTEKDLQKEHAENLAAKKEDPVEAALKIVPEVN